MLKTRQQAITEGIMFLEHPRSHFLTNSRPPSIDLAKKDKTSVYMIYLSISLYNIYIYNIYNIYIIYIIYIYIYNIRYFLKQRNGRFSIYWNSKRMVIAIRVSQTPKCFTTFLEIICCNNKASLVNMLV